MSTGPFGEDMQLGMRMLDPGTEVTIRAHYGLEAEVTRLEVSWDPPRAAYVTISRELLMELIRMAHPTVEVVES